MEFKISNKKLFLDDFIYPLSKFAENVSLTLDSGVISALVSSTNKTIVSNFELKEPSVSEKMALHVPDLKKFYRLISFIQDDIKLVIDNNSINYTSDDLRFKYHLYDSSVIPTTALDIKKLATLEFDGSFTITREKITNAIKGSVLYPDISKFYLTNEKNTIHLELTDKAQDNTNNYSILLSNDFKGVFQKTSVPLDFEILRLIDNHTFNFVNVKFLSSRGVFLFELKLQDLTINYVISALTK